MKVLPMLATLVDAPFDDPNWVFEIKWDGCRAIGFKNKSVRLISRRNQMFNDRFPQIAEELQQLPGQFIVDGEIVILDAHGRSRFQLLQNYQKNKQGSPYYYLFDILSYNGNDLADLPLLERKKILKNLLRGRHTYLRVCETIKWAIWLRQSPYNRRSQTGAYCINTYPFAKPCGRRLYGAFTLPKPFTLLFHRP